MTTYSVRFIVAGVERREVFTQRDAAWAFMRDCETQGILAGFPDYHPAGQK